MYFANPAAVPSNWLSRTFLLPERPGQQVFAQLRVITARLFSQGENKRPPTEKSSAAHPGCCGAPTPRRGRDYAELFFPPLQPAGAVCRRRRKSRSISGSRRKQFCIIIISLRLEQNYLPASQLSGQIRKPGDWLHGSIWGKQWRRRRRWRVATCVRDGQN